MVGFGHPYLLFLLPFVLGWIYWTYARRRPPVVPAAGVWLLEASRVRGRALRRVDLRLLALLAAGLFVTLALADPVARWGKPERLVVVIDASASMAATPPGGPSRFDRARERAFALLGGVREGVLVRAGLEPAVYGPAGGAELQRRLAKLRPGDAAADLRAAARAGLRRLPGAPLIVVGDTPPPPDLRAGFFDVAGREPNVGITALGSDFAAVFNAGPRPWRGSLTSEGEVHALELPPERFAVVRFDDAQGRRVAALAPDDALALDQAAYLARRAPQVRLADPAPALRRALAALGVRSTGERNAPVVRIGMPPPEPLEQAAVHFAPEAAAPPEPVFDVDPLHPFARGVELVGYRLPAPPAPPGEGWRVIASFADGRGAIYARGSELYLPPLASLQDLPALVVLLYNWSRPLVRSYEPLGQDGRLAPGFAGGRAYSLLSYGETRLPRPQGDRLEPLTSRRPLAPWLALAAAVLLALQAPRPARRAVG